MSRLPTVLLAHPKKWSEDQVTEAFALLQAQLPGKQLVSGKADWNLNFKTAGSWNAWVQSWPRRHSGLIVTGDKDAVGKATTQGVRVMLSRGKPVVWFDGAHIWRVGGIAEGGDPWWPGSLILV